MNEISNFNKALQPNQVYQDDADAAALTDLDSDNQENKIPRDSTRPKGTKRLQTEVKHLKAEVLEKEEQIEELTKDMKILTQESKMITSQFEKSVKANEHL